MIPPNVNEDSQKMKEAEWRGYMYKAVEDIDEELGRVRTENQTSHKELRDELAAFREAVTDEQKKTNEKVNSLYVKVAGMGGAAGIITTIVMNYLVK